jgi:2-aminoadipate transaminase
MNTVETLDGIRIFPRPQADGDMGGLDVPTSPEAAAWTKGVRPSIIAEMLKVMARPGIVSFALGYPANELFPVDEWADCARRVMEKDRYVLQYRPPFQGLKAQVVELMARRGVHCTEEQVLLTTAAQQGLSLLAQLLLEPGGEVICEKLVYTGFQAAIEPLSPRILTVGTDLDGATGIDVDAVAELLAGGARPAFIYVITDGHNPLGVSVSAEKRTRLVALARRYGVPIVEDDAYGMLNYERPLPPLRAMDDRWVYHVGSFSKVMAPGFRVGWVVAPAQHVRFLAAAKEGADIDSQTFTQRLVSEYIATGAFDGHLERVRAAYRERRDTMLAALARHFPTGARFNRPTNGALIWLELPEGVDTGVLLPIAVETERVAFVPGHAFATDRRTGANCMRLNFSHASPAQIDDGIARIARAVRATFG